MNEMDGVRRSEVDTRYSFVCVCVHLFTEVYLKMSRDMKRNLICANTMAMAHVMTSNATRFQFVRKCLCMNCD